MAETVIVQPGEVDPLDNIHILADTVCIKAPTETTCRNVDFIGGGTQGMVFFAKEEERNLVVKLYPVEMGRFLNDLTQRIIDADNQLTREAYYGCRTPADLNQLDSLLCQPDFNIANHILWQKAVHLPEMARSYYSDRSLPEDVDWRSDGEQRKATILKIRKLLEKRCVPTEAAYENQITDRIEANSTRYATIEAIDPDTFQVITDNRKVARTAIQSGRVVVLFSAFDKENNEIGKFYGTMYEAVEGVTLDEYQPQSLAEALVIMNRIAHSTEADFEAGLYNLDIKPDNIIVEGLNPVIIDRALTLYQHSDGSLQSPIPAEYSVYNATTLMPDSFNPIIVEPFKDITEARIRKDIILTTLALLGIEYRRPLEGGIPKLNQFGLVEISLLNQAQIVKQINENPLFTRFNAAQKSDISHRIYLYLHYYSYRYGRFNDDIDFPEYYNNATDLLHHLFTEPLGIDKLQSLEMD